MFTTSNWSLLWCDTESTGKQFLMFWRIMMSLSSGWSGASSLPAWPWREHITVLQKDNSVTEQPPSKAAGRSSNSLNLLWIKILWFPSSAVKRRWADNFCLHCKNFIYIRSIWIKVVLFSRMVSMFHYTSSWTHRWLQSSKCAHRNGRVFRRSVQTACCYWSLNRGKSSPNWNSQANASRLWWSVCCCEYTKTVCKVKCVLWVH